MAERKPRGYWNNKERCAEAARQFSSRHQFNAHKSAAYQAAKRNGWLDEFFPEERRPAGYWAVKQHCIEAGKGCKTRSEFHLKFSAASRSAKKNGWTEECVGHLPGRMVIDCSPRPKQDCLISAHKYGTPSEWQRAEGPMYHRAWRNGWLGECCAHMAKKAHLRPRGYWKVKQNCIDAARQCETRKEFATRFKGAYKSATKYGWLEECCRHMKPLIQRGGRGRHQPTLIYTLDECKQSALRFENRYAWQIGDGVYYRTAHKNGWLDKCCEHMDLLIKCDYDAIYFWEWVEDGKGTGIYKPGLTSWRLGTRRIEQCARDNGIDYRLVALCHTSPGDAIHFEKIMLDLGDTVALPDHIVDGRTEFRIYSESELALIYQLLGAQESALAMAA